MLLKLAHAHPRSLQLVVFLSPLPFTKNAANTATDATNMDIANANRSPS